MEFFDCIHVPDRTNGGFLFRKRLISWGAITINNNVYRARPETCNADAVSAIMAYLCNAAAYLEFLCQAIRPESDRPEKDEWASFEAPVWSFPCSCNCIFNVYVCVGSKEKLTPKSSGVREWGYVTKFEKY